MSDLGKILVLIGVLLVVIGLLVGTNPGKSWLGHLPGDFNYSRGNFSFHFPLMTCIVISLLLTVLLRWFRK